MTFQKCKLLVALLTLFLLCAVPFAGSVQTVKAQYSGPIYIRSNGSVDPSTAPIQRVENVYTLAADINGNITVQKDNIVIDGAGYTIQGSELNLSEISVATIGIDIQNRVNVTIKSVQVKSFVNGIHLLNSSESSIIGNNIMENVDGVRLDSSSDNTIIGNNITSNFHGIHPFFNNKFYHNNLINNTYHVYIRPEDSVNSWNNGHPSGGNYWSNYTGVDVDNDGIGDTPHIIDSNNTDSFPLMAPFYEQAQPNKILLYFGIGVIAAVTIVAISILFLKKKTAGKPEKKGNQGINETR